jgi:hypothetical protein
MAAFLWDNQSYLFNLLKVKQEKLSYVFSNSCSRSHQFQRDRVGSPPRAARRLARSAGKTTKRAGEQKKSGRE